MPIQTFKNKPSLRIIRRGKKSETFPLVSLIVVIIAFLFFCVDSFERCVKVKLFSLLTMTVAFVPGLALKQTKGFLVTG